MCCGLTSKLKEWVTDSPFIISPRITFEVSVRLLGGLMALGYTIATILKRSSHTFSDDKVCVKIDWLEQLSRRYVQVQGKDRSYVKHVAEQLGLEGSYVPRTYIEQIQLERLQNDVMALPDDLKTKLSIDDELASSPKEALSRASANKRTQYLSRGMSRSFSVRDKNFPRLTRLDVNDRRFDGRALDSPPLLPNQGAMTQLSEHIWTLNERMDEVMARMECLNSKLSVGNVSAEACSGPTSCCPTTGLGNGLVSSQLMDEISVIFRGQQQIMHQLEDVKSMVRGVRELVGILLALSLAVGVLAGLSLRNTILM